MLSLTLLCLFQQKFGVFRADTNMRVRSPGDDDDNVLIALYQILVRCDKYSRQHNTTFFV